MSDALFTLNFTDEDVASEGSEPKGFVPIPNGIYELALVELELKETGPNAKNPGKPMVAVKASILDEKYEGRYLWFNLMLFDLPPTKDGRSGNWFISQFLKSAGYQVEAGGFSFPSLAELEGKTVTATVITKTNIWNGERTKRNEVNGFISSDEKIAAPKGRTKRNSLLP